MICGSFLAACVQVVDPAELNMHLMRMIEVRTRQPTPCVSSPHHMRFGRPVSWSRSRTSRQTGSVTTIAPSGLTRLQSIKTALALHRWAPTSGLLERWVGPMLSGIGPLRLLSAAVAAAAHIVAAMKNGGIARVAMVVLGTSAALVGAVGVGAVAPEAASGASQSIPRRGSGSGMWSLRCPCPRAEPGSPGVGSLRSQERT